MNVRTGITAGTGAAAFTPSMPTIIDVAAVDVAEQPLAAAAKDRAKTRSWELDVLRGAAVSLMLWYHLLRAWLPAWVNVLMPPAVSLLILLILEGALFWQVYRRAPTADFPLPPDGRKRTVVKAAGLLVWTGLVFLLVTTGFGAGMFLLVSGMTLALTYNRAQHKGSEAQFKSRTARRALQVLAMAALISLITLLIMPVQWVYFGALHMIGISLLLTIPFLGLPAWVLLTAGLGLAAVVAPWSLALSELGALLPGLGIVGITHSPLVSALFPLLWKASIDYYPLLPSFGFMLAGLGAGKLLLKEGEFSLDLPDFSQTRIGKGLRWLGKNAFQVYLGQEIPLVLGFWLQGVA